MKTIDEKFYRIVQKGGRFEDAEILNLIENRWKIDSALQARIIPSALMYFYKRRLKLSIEEQDLLEAFISFLNYEATNYHEIHSADEDEIIELKSLHDEKEAYMLYIDSEKADFISSILSELKIIWGRKLFIDEEFQQSIDFYRNKAHKE